MRFAAKLAQTINYAKITRRILLIGKQRVTTAIFSINSSILGIQLKLQNI